MRDTLRVFFQRWFPNWNQIFPWGRKRGVAWILYPPPPGPAKPLLTPRWALCRAICKAAIAAYAGGIPPPPDLDRA